MPIQTRKLDGSSRLNPSAKPVDTYHRPTPQPVQGPPIGQNGFQQLASALGLLGGAFGGLDAKNKKQADAQAQLNADKIVYGTPQEQLKDSLGENSQLPDNVQQQAIEQGLGYRIGNEMLSDALRRVNGESTAPEGDPSNAFDRDNGDLDEFWRGIMQEYLTDPRTNQSPEAAAVIKNILLKGYQSALNQQNKYQIVKQKQTAISNTSSEMMSSIYEDIQNGERDPAKIHSKLRSYYAGYKKTYGLSNQDIDQAMMDTATRLAEEGRYEIVKEILFSERDGVGALGHKTANLSRAKTILNRADQQRIAITKKVYKPILDKAELDAQEGSLEHNKEFHKIYKEHPGIISDEKYRTMVDKNKKNAIRIRKEMDEFQEKQQLKFKFEQQEKGIDDRLSQLGTEGKLQTMGETVTAHDDKGKPITYTKKQLRKRAVENYLESSAVIASSKKETPEQKFNRDLKWFASNGVTNPQWKDILNGGALGATVETTNDTDNLPVNLKEGVELYKQMQAKNPLALKLHLTDKGSRDFYDLFTRAKELGHADDASALRAARIAMNDEQHPTERVSYKAVADHVEDEENSFWPWNDDLLPNANVLNKDVHRAAELYSRLGMSGEKAIELAYENVSKDYSNINGYYVKTGDVEVMMFPQIVKRKSNIEPDRSFGEAAEDYIKTYASENGLDPDDLIIMNEGNSKAVFSIFNKTTGLPVVQAKGKLPAEMTIEGLATLEANKLVADREKITKDLKEENKRQKVHKKQLNALGIYDNPLQRPEVKDYLKNQKPKDETRLDSKSTKSEKNTERLSDNKEIKTAKVKEKVDQVLKKNETVSPRKVQVETFKVDPKTGKRIK